MKFLSQDINKHGLPEIKFNSPSKLMFPIWDKILKPRFRWLRKKTWENPSFLGFWTHVILCG